jgi:hypothetical protein
MASTQQKDYLEKKEFVKALKLIAIYQEYGSLSRWEDLLGSAKVKLATFKADGDSPSE